jgi:hypothetical protein
MSVVSTWAYVVRAPASPPAMRCMSLSEHLAPWNAYPERADAP